MKKTFKMVDLDCAHCAGKMEVDINKIDGVINATISFMTQKLVLETDESKNFDDIAKKITKAVKKYEPNCEVLFK